MDDESDDDDIIVIHDKTDPAYVKMDQRRRENEAADRDGLLKKRRARIVHGIERTWQNKNRRHVKIPQEREDPPTTKETAVGALQILLKGGDNRQWGERYRLINYLALPVVVQGRKKSDHVFDSRDKKAHELLEADTRFFMERIFSTDLHAISKCLRVSKVFASLIGVPPSFSKAACLWAARMARPFSLSVATNDFIADLYPEEFRTTVTDAYYSYVIHKENAPKRPNKCLGHTMFLHDQLCTRREFAENELLHTIWRKKSMFMFHPDRAPSAPPFTPYKMIYDHIFKHAGALDDEISATYKKTWAHLRNITQSRLAECSQDHNQTIVAMSRNTWSTTFKTKHLYRALPYATFKGKNGQQRSTWPTFISKAWDNTFDPTTPTCQSCAMQDMKKLKDYKGDCYSSGTLREAVAVNIVNATMAEIARLINADVARAISPHTDKFRTAINDLLPPHGPHREEIELQLAPFFRAVYIREQIREYFLVCDDGYSDRSQDEEGSTTDISKIAGVVSDWANALTIFPTAKAIMLLSWEGRNVLLQTPGLARTRLSNFFDVMRTSDMLQYCNLRGADIAMNQLASISHAFPIPKDKWVIQLVLRRLTVSTCVVLCDDIREEARTEQRRLIDWISMLNRHKVGSGSIFHHNQDSPSSGGISFTTPQLDYIAIQRKAERAAAARYR